MGVARPPYLFFFPVGPHWNLLFLLLAITHLSNWLIDDDWMAEPLFRAAGTRLLKPSNSRNMSICRNQHENYHIKCRQGFINNICCTRNMSSEWEITLHTEHFNYANCIIKRLMKKNVLSSTYPALGNVQRGHSQKQKLPLAYVYFTCCHMYTHAVILKSLLDPSPDI